MKSLVIFSFLCVILVHHSSGEGLTDDEIEIFRSNGVTVDTETYRRFMMFSSDGLPDQDIIDQFPMARNNPNSVTEQDYNYRIPTTITRLAEGSEHCLVMGPIAMTVDGVVFYSPDTSSGGNAVTDETMGKCNGHPDTQGRYHHHAINNCTYTGEADQLLGVAFDGYPILSNVTADGIVDEDELDACHGHDYNGRYVYRITNNYPYIMGCYRGEPMNLGGKSCVAKRNLSDRTLMKMLLRALEN